MYQHIRWRPAGAVRFAPSWAALQQLLIFHYTINEIDMLCNDNKMLSYGRETARQGALVLAKSGRLELGDNIYGHYTVWVKKSSPLKTFCNIFT